MEPFSGETYWVNDHDTMIRIYTDDRHPFLITKGSALAAAQSTQAGYNAARRRGFRKRAIILFALLTFILTVIIGFRDLTSIGFWILIGVFAAVSLVYALLFAGSTVFTRVPDCIPVRHSWEEVDSLFIHLKPIDRDTLFREIERSPYTTEYLLDQLRYHYNGQYHKNPWKLHRK